VYANQHALQLWHQVRVSFAGGCATWPPESRAALLQQLLSSDVLAALHTADATGTQFSCFTRTKVQMPTLRTRI
jgi:hypothetical protein